MVNNPNMINKLLADFNKISKQVIKEAIKEVIKEGETQDMKTLEQFKRELIDILKQDNKDDRYSVQTYEKMRRNCEDEFYKKSYQTEIHKLNAKREVRRSILKLLENKSVGG